MLAANSIVVATRDQVSADLGGDIAILQLKSGIYYGLNPIGARIWELIQQPRALEELETILTEEYDVPRARLAADLRLLCEELAGAGLVEFS